MLLLHHEVVLLLFDFLQVCPDAKGKVSGHVGILCLELLHLGSGDIVSDACRKPAIAHKGGVERDIGAFAVLAM